MFVYMVYVQDINGKPMMPTTRYGKVRRLLKDKKAVVVNLCPFTIKLTYVTSDYKQEIVLGVDAGTKHVGLSATTKSKELYSSEVILRNDIVDLLSTRRELRRARRNRLRYRKPRFNNRIKSKRPGWTAPSVKYKIDAHIRVIDNVFSILPVSRIVIEVAQFDTQKIKNPNISGKEYQEGDQLGFWNTREYVLARDGHKCQYCKGKSKDKILNVHHLESRKTGGDSPSNLITLNLVKTFRGKLFKKAFGRARRGKDINSFEKQEKVDGLNFLYNPNNDRMRNGHIIIDGTGLFKQIMKSGT